MSHARRHIRRARAELGKLNLLVELLESSTRPRVEPGVIDMVETEPGVYVPRQTPRVGPLAGILGVLDQVEELDRRARELTRRGGRHG